MTIERERERAIVDASKATQVTLVVRRRVEANGMLARGVVEVINSYNSGGGVGGASERVEAEVEIE